MGVMELRISRILVQDAPGHRRTPVAPNAYAAYRGYEVVEPLVRIQTSQGIEGIARVLEADRRRDVLQRLIGLNPFDLFRWRDDRYDGPSELHGELVNRLGSMDVGIFDLLGHATGRPAADVLGRRCQDSVHVYDSTLYMDDLLTPEQRTGLVYLEGKPPPVDDAEMVARKAEWLVERYYREQGVRIFKIKTGRAKWMESYEAALKRDIAVFRAVRDAVGADVTLIADANNGYDADYTAAKRFIEETSEKMLFGMEEMFREEMVDEHREVAEYSDSLGLHVRTIDGETGGIPSRLLKETVQTRRGRQPLFEINNPSFSHGAGFVQAFRIARECRELGIDIAPHNFSSKMAFAAAVQMGHAVPNWAFVETDDAEYPGLKLSGIEMRDGKARLTGAAGLGVELDRDGLGPVRFVVE